MTTELELNLRLDSNCRTTFDPDSEFIVNNKKSTSSSSSSSSIDYSSKTVLTSLTNESTVQITTKIDTSISTSNNKTNNMNSTTISQSCTREDEVIISQEDKMKLLDDLLFDCEITDCALLPRTFWMPCSGMEVSLVSSIGSTCILLLLYKLLIDTSNHNINIIVIICKAKMFIRTVCIRGI